MTDETQSKRGRKTKAELAAETELNAEETQVLAKMEERALAAAALANEQQAERDMANRLLGRIQLGQGIQKMVTVTNLTDLKQIKESKAYKHLSTIIDGKLVTVTSWADFCLHLGVSREKVDQDLLNLEAFGGEALESMQQMGLGYRQLREIRQLPSEAREEITAAVEAGDKDHLLKTMDDMSLRHQKELKKRDDEAEALRKQVAAAQDTIQLKQKRLEADQNKIEELTNRVAKHEIGLSYDEKTAALETSINTGLNALLNGQPNAHSLLSLVSDIRKLWSLDRDEPEAHLQQLAQNSLVRIVAMCKTVAEERDLLWNPDEIDDRLYMPDQDDEPHHDDMLDGMTVHRIEDYNA